MLSTPSRALLATLSALTAASCSDLPTRPTASTPAGGAPSFFDAPGDEACVYAPLDPISAGGTLCRIGSRTFGDVTFEGLGHNEVLTGRVIAGARFTDFRATFKQDAPGGPYYDSTVKTAPSPHTVAYWICIDTTGTKCETDYARTVDFVRPVQKVSFSYGKAYDRVMANKKLSNDVILEAYDREGQRIAVDSANYNNSGTSFTAWDPISVQASDNLIYRVVIRGSPNKVVIDNYATEALNHAPVARATWPTTAKEGTAARFSAALSYDAVRAGDTGETSDLRDVIGTYHWDFGDGEVLTTTDSVVTHLYRRSGEPNVTLTVTDPNGVSHSLSQVVTIANVPPAITLGDNPPPAPGQPFTLDATFSDDGEEEYWTYQIDWGAGYSAPETLTATGAIPGSRLLASGTHTIKVKVTDRDGASDEETLQVVVANAPPVAKFTYPKEPVEEGSPVSLDGSLSTDSEPGTLRYLWDFGDGEGSTDESTSHSYGDNGEYTITLTVTDSDGATSTSVAKVTIANATPTLNAGPGATIIEGASFTLGASVTDPGEDDEWTYMVDWGNGTTTGTAPGANFSLTRPYLAPGSYDVRISVKDDDGAVSNVVTVTVKVLAANHAPTAAANGPYTGLEGSAVAFTAAGSIDPDGDALSYAWNFGDGGTGSGLTFSHPYADDGSYLVTLTVTDVKGAATVVTTSAKVENVAPTVNVGSVATVPYGFPLERSGTITDPGSDAVTATVNYGDGTGTFPLAITNGSVQLHHLYATPGSYTVVVTANDGDGGVTTRQFLVAALPPLAATIRIEPEALKRNQIGKGTITVFVDTRLFDLANIDPATVTLGNRSGQDTPLARKNNGSYEVNFTPAHAIFKFDRAELLANGDLPTAAGVATLYLRGQLRSGGPMGGSHFEGSDQVRVIP